MCGVKMPLSSSQSDGFILTEYLRRLNYHLGHTETSRLSWMDHVVVLDGVSVVFPVALSKYLLILSSLALLEFKIIICLMIRHFELTSTPHHVQSFFIGNLQSFVEGDAQMPIHVKLLAVRPSAYLR